MSLRELLHKHPQTRALPAVAQAISAITDPREQQAVLGDALALMASSWGPREVRPGIWWAYLRPRIHADNQDFLDQEIARLRAVDQLYRIRCKYWGRRRKLGLRPQLSAAALASAEAQLGVAFPEAMQVFLTRIGDGGGFHREFPTDSPMFSVSSMAESVRDPEWLRRPFPWRTPISWSEHPEARSVPVGGTVPLANMGCGIWWHLVVCGPERGNVWLSWEGGWDPTWPRRDVLGWYEDNLDGMDFSELTTGIISDWLLRY